MTKSKKPEPMVQVFLILVRPSRLELPTSAMSRQRSNQLSYGRIVCCREDGANNSELLFVVQVFFPRAELFG